MKKNGRKHDAYLVKEFLNGNKSALEELVNRWHFKFCKQAYWYIGDSSVSKDIAQETWVTIINKLDTLKKPEHFGSWALSIVNRKSVDYVRKKQKEVFLKNETELTSEEKSDEFVEVKKVLNEIKKLPIEQQTVLKLFYIEQYKLNEIAKLLQVPAGTVKSRLYNAREYLKITLKNRKHER